MNEVRNIIVGFEMGEKTSQICYFDRTEGEPVSLSVIAGQSQYAFPTCISKKRGEAVYHYGVEAEYFAAHQDEILIDRLLERCLLEEPVQVEDQMVKPSSLAAIFLGQALGMLGANNLSKNISGIMVTVPRLTRPLVENLREAFQILQFPAGRCFLQTYDESFYYYTISQKPEFWSRKAEKDTAGNQTGYGDTTGLLCRNLGSFAGDEWAAGTDCPGRSPAGNQCRGRAVFVYCELPVYIPRLFDGFPKYSSGNGLQLSRHYLRSLGAGRKESGRLAGRSWSRFYSGLPGKSSGLDICSVLLYLHGEIFPEEKRKKTKLDLKSL